MGTKTVENRMRTPSEAGHTTSRNLTNPRSSSHSRSPSSSARVRRVTPSLVPQILCTFECAQILRSVKHPTSSEDVRCPQPSSVSRLLGPGRKLEAERRAS